MAISSSVGPVDPDILFSGLGFSDVTIKLTRPLVSDEAASQGVGVGTPTGLNRANLLHSTT